MLHAEYTLSECSKRPTGIKGILVDDFISSLAITAAPRLVVSVELDDARERKLQEANKASPAEIPKYMSTHLICVVESQRSSGSLLKPTH